MAKEGKGYNQSMFTNKDGYLKGGVDVKKDFTSFLLKFLYF